MENRATKRSRTVEYLSDGISQAVRECVEAIVCTVEERLRSWAPLPRTDGRAKPASELNSNGATPTTSNVTTQGSKTLSNNPLVIRDFPAELSRMVSGSTATPSVMTEAYLESLFEMGYDSDGEFAEFTHKGDEAAMMEYVEDEMTNNIASPQQDAESAAPVNNNSFILITDEQLGKLKLDEMRQECKKRGLRIGGRKADLVDRLKKAMVDKVPIINTKAS